MTRAVSDPDRAVRRYRWAVAAAAALGAGLLQAGPAQAGDPAAGKALALQWCSACHVVADDQATASSVSLPSFFDMARDPDWSEETLATFLANPHPQMPNMSLGNMEIANLAAYIGSLAP